MSDASEECKRQLAFEFAFFEKHSNHIKIEQDTAT